MFLHVSVCDQHQGARTWAQLKLQLLKHSVKYVVIHYAVVWQHYIVCCHTTARSHLVIRQHHHI